jgi:serine/threonine-protein kinase RsbT
MDEWDACVNIIRKESDIIIILAKLRGKAIDLGFRDAELVKILTAASELLRNIIKYANFGEITISTIINTGKTGLKFVAKDNGPGIANIEQALSNNFSTSGTLGMGLPGVKRLVDGFDIHSVVGVGTTVTFEVWKM